MKMPLLHTHIKLSADSTHAHAIVDLDDIDTCLNQLAAAQAEVLRLTQLANDGIYWHGEHDRLKAKLATYEDALRKIATTTRDVEGDSTFNQTYQVPTPESNIAIIALNAKLAESEKPPMGHRCDHCGKYTDNKAEGTFILCDACNGKVFQKLENATMPELRAWVSGMEKKLAAAEAGKVDLGKLADELDEFIHRLDPSERGIYDFVRNWKEAQ